MPAGGVRKPVSQYSEMKFAIRVLVKLLYIIYYILK